MSIGSLWEISIKLGLGKLKLQNSFSDLKPVLQTLKIEIGNPGALPKWRGVAGDGWLFIDEIEVYGHEK